MEAKSKNAKKRKFKFTKELVKLALNDKWTQQEIADLCRVNHQSIVSDWKKGKTQATEQVLKPLLDLYGNKLRRNTFRVYHAYNPETQEHQYYRVEGKVILSEAISNAFREEQLTRLSKYRTYTVPMFRVIVHHQGEKNFRMILQTKIKSPNYDQQLDCSREEGNWSSQISDQISAEEVINRVDEFSKSDDLKNYPHDVITLPFLIRDAMIMHGFESPDVVDYPAVW
jgi:hypothetical protein